MTVSRRAIVMAIVAVLVVAVVTGVRFYRLDQVPAEWYGDISTLYEYAMAERQGDFPPGLYILGVGPLYPLSVMALLTVLPTSYYTIKLTAVLWSLAGLAALFFLCRRLHGPAFAALATLVAGTGSWLLSYSRLGDVEAAVPFVAMAALALAVAHRRDAADQRGAGPAVRRGDRGELLRLWRRLRGAAAGDRGAGRLVALHAAATLRHPSPLGVRGLAGGDAGAAGRELRDRGRT